MRDLVLNLALALRETALQCLGEQSARSHADSAHGGDVTFELDRQAEGRLSAFLAEHAPDVAFFSEDRGLVHPTGGPGHASHVLVVDPIDGTRPALAGLESCCVSIACAPCHDDVTMGEVTAGCVVEIPSGAVFLAERGTGLIEAPPVKLSTNQRIERMFWTFGFRGRPARPTAEVLAELIDASSVGGATFDLGSASFDMTRILTGQLDAYVEPGPLLVAGVEGMQAEFERVGSGSVLNNSPYDVAAAALCCEEGGATVTDACGEPLDRRPLLGSGPDHQMSVVASANPHLHAQIVDAIATGVERLRATRARGSHSRW